MPCARHVLQGTPESGVKEAGSARRPPPRDQPRLRRPAAHSYPRRREREGRPPKGPRTTRHLDAPLHTMPCARHVLQETPESAKKPGTRRQGPASAQTPRSPQLPTKTRTRGQTTPRDHEPAAASMPRCTPCRAHGTFCREPRTGEETRDQTPGTSLGSDGPQPTATREDANARADHTTRPRTSRHLDAPLHTMPRARHILQETPESAKKPGTRHHGPASAQTARSPQLPTKMRTRGQTQGTTNQPPLRCPAAHHAARTAHPAGNPRIGRQGSRKRAQTARTRAAGSPTSRSQPTAPHP
ncbi:hypothetical protein J2790_003146 [Paenarthrobacter nicotinovorans]|nr:hypothetical protein [Paenarthrobacter nicotinovorans]SCZ62490.1 hypothetical protein SAMN02799638_03395 [Arthrobacter sp. UNCCL28]